jgi:hypothetical protein
VLVRRGYLSGNDLRSILRSAVIDALIVLTMPLVGGSSVLDIRFEAPGAHWAAEFLRLSLESVQPDVTRRAAQMASAGVAHTAPVALRDLARPSAILTRTQWAIASRVDGTLSPRDLARQSGLSLYETVTSIGALIRAGLCAPAALELHEASRPAPATVSVLASAPVSSLPPAATATTPLAPDAMSRLLTRTASPAHGPDMATPVPARPAQPAAAAMVPPVRPAPGESSPGWSPTAAPDAHPAAVTHPRWPGRSPAAPHALAADPTSSPTSAAAPTPVAAATTGPRARTNGSGSPATPRHHNSFAPAATPALRTPSGPPASPVAPTDSADTGPLGTTPALNPAPVDVPAVAVASSGSPSYPTYRQSARPPWPQSDAPVPPETLTGLPGRGDPPDPDLQRAAAVRAEPAGARAARVTRGAHRADRSFQPEPPNRAASLPPDPVDGPSPEGPPYRLPQRQPGRRATRPYAGTPRPWSQAPTEPIPAVAGNWPRPGSFTTPPDPDGSPDRPTPPERFTVPEPAGTPAPTSPATTTPHQGEAEPEEYAPAVPDLLRRVLDGLRRLT